MQSTFKFALAIIALGALSGCGHTETSHDHEAEPAAAGSSAHAHGETGPHGGHLIELGDYHVEVVSDHDAHMVAIHLLDGDVEELTDPIEATVIISVFQDGEFVDYTLPDADAPGVFALENEELCEALDHSQDVRARIKVTIDGEELVAPYEHEAHEDH